ncbi:MAG: TetR/AcrR family transcriptional regulator [Thermodesulfobacteriota bacterium]
MEAALELIAEKGFHGAPMAEIAEKAKVAAGTIYTYFESKDVLINELHQELEKRITFEIQENFPAFAPLRERFLYLFGKVLQYFLKHPLHFRFLEQYYNSPYGISLRRERILGKSEGQTLLMDIFEQGVEENIVKKFPNGILASLTFGPLFFLVRDHTLGFINLEEPLLEQMAEACWDAIKI